MSVARCGLLRLLNRNESTVKRFHIHIHVDDLTQSVAFYSRLFAAEPARVEADYAKWMLDDPRVNFAISTRGHKPGLDHLGFQVDEAAELADLKARTESADMALLDEGATTCCYARSEDHWVTDPQGIAWEHFQTLGSIPVFNDPGQAAEAGACCGPTPNDGEIAASACCAPKATETSTACCTPAPTAVSSKTDLHVAVPTQPNPPAVDSFKS